MVHFAIFAWQDSRAIYLFSFLFFWGGGGGGGAEGAAAPTRKTQFFSNMAFEFAELFLVAI